MPTFVGVLVPSKSRKALIFENENMTSQFGTETTTFLNRVDYTRGALNTGSTSIRESVSPSIVNALRREYEEAPSLLQTRR